MKVLLVRFFFVIPALLFGLLPIYGQKARTAAKPPAEPAGKPIIFAVLNEGQMIEPIAYVDKDTLTEPVGGDSEAADIEKFDRSYYGSKRSYRLIFGGANAGTVAINSFDPKAECSRNMAQVKVTSTRAKLAGKIMALATNVVGKTKGSGVRRLPTWPERNEIDKLVRDEFARQKVEFKELRYHNLTALDVDSDKTIELVGSFWVASGEKTRSLFFFIADKDSDGKFKFGHSELRAVKEEDVMSGDISTIDDGIYHELLLDVFDYDGDRVAEVFTYTQSFEGAGFKVYRRENGSWNKKFEVSNYHCGY